MTYPINLCSFVAEESQDREVSAAEKKLYCVIIPVVNSWYWAGRAGRKCYPAALDKISASTLADITAVRKLLQVIVDWCNAAYLQGEQDAQSLSRQ